MFHNYCYDSEIFDWLFTRDGLDSAPENGKYDLNNNQRDEEETKSE